jgi:ribonuclease HI
VDTSVEPRIIFTDSEMRVNAIEKWVTEHAKSKEFRITTRCVAVPSSATNKEQYTKVEELNQILVHVVVGHGMKEHSTDEIYETFRLRNKLNKFGVDFVRQEVEREKKHKSSGTRKQVRIFSILVD